MAGFVERKQILEESILRRVINDLDRDGLIITNLASPLSFNLDGEQQWNEMETRRHIEARTGKLLSKFITLLSGSRSQASLLPRNPPSFLLDGHR